MYIIGNTVFLLPFCLLSFGLFFFTTKIIINNIFIIIIPFFQFLFLYVYVYHHLSSQIVDANLVQNSFLFLGYEMRYCRFCT